MLRIFFQITFFLFGYEGLPPEVCRYDFETCCIYITKQKVLRSRNLYSNDCTNICSNGTEKTLLREDQGSRAYGPLVQGKIKDCAGWPWRSECLFSCSSCHWVRQRDNTNCFEPHTESDVHTKRLVMDLHERGSFLANECPACPV